MTQEEWMMKQEFKAMIKRLKQERLTDASPVLNIGMMVHDEYPEEEE